MVFTTKYTKALNKAPRVKKYSKGGKVTDREAWEEQIAREKERLPLHVPSKKLEDDPSLDKSVEDFYKKTRAKMYDY
jgi:hypothetical protein